MSSVQFVQVETVYIDDCGTQENVFRLSKEELKQRQVGEFESGGRQTAMSGGHRHRRL